MNDNQVVKPVVIDWISALLEDKAHRSKVKLNGQYVTYEIYKKMRDGNMLSIYIYLETEEGYVKEAQLLTSSGEVWAVKPFSIEKKDDGLIIAFQFDIEVRERGASDGI